VQREGKVGYEGSFGQIAPPPLAGEPHVVDKGFVDMLAGQVGRNICRMPTDLIYQLRSRQNCPRNRTGRVLNQNRPGVGLKAFQEMVAPGPIRKLRLP